MTDANDRPVNTAASARLGPNALAGNSSGGLAVRNDADGTAGIEGRTPVRILAQLSPDPGPVPMGFTAMTGEDITLGLLDRGDAIGIDGRWCPVVGCTSVNGWVTVDTAYGYPVITAFMDVPIHLARVVDAEMMADR